MHKIIPFDFQKFSLLKHSHINILKKNLIEDEQRIISLASECSGTPIKYHKRDFQIVLEFLDKLIPMFEKYNEVLRTANTIAMPKGNILVVLSANEPIILSTIPIISALLLGNVLYVKAASQNFKFVSYISRLMNKSLNSNKFNMYQFSKQEIKGIASESYFNSVYWFGSSSTISSVAPIFLKNLVDFSYECEGNDYIYIGLNADLDEACNVIINSIATHNGQCCNAIKGILVNKKNFSTLKTKILEKINNLKISTQNENCDLSYSAYQFQIFLFHPKVHQDELPEGPC